MAAALHTTVACVSRGAAHASTRTGFPRDACGMSSRTHRPAHIAVRTEPLAHVTVVARDAQATSASHKCPTRDQAIRRPMRTPLCVPNLGACGSLAGASSVCLGATISCHKQPTLCPVARPCAHGGRRMANAQTPSVLSFSRLHLFTAPPVHSSTCSQLHLFTAPPFANSRRCRRPQTQAARRCARALRERRR